MPRKQCPLLCSIRKSILPLNNILLVQDKLQIKRYMMTHGKHVAVEQIGNFSMAHTGVCYRNSKFAPSSAEKPQSAMMTCDLLVNRKGNHAGDDRAIFAKIVTSGNDTRAPFSFIRKQNLLIGTSADNLAEHLPDKCHVMKCENNTLLKIRKDDKSYSGVNLPSNLRIKSIVSDIK